MSFELNISPKDRAAGRFIGKTRRALIDAALEEKARSGITQLAVADKLGVHRSVINRLLRGSGNLTLRTVAEIAWAIGWEPKLTFRRKHVAPSANEIPEPAAGATQTLSFDASAPAASARPSGQGGYVVTRVRENA